MYLLSANSCSAMHYQSMTTTTPANCLNCCRGWGSVSVGFDRNGSSNVVFASSENNSHQWQWRANISAARSRQWRHWYRGQVGKALELKLVYGTPHVYKQSSNATRFSVFQLLLLRPPETSLFYEGLSRMKAVAFPELDERANMKNRLVSS